MSLASNKLGVRYLGNFTADGSVPSSRPPAAAPESFENKQPSPAPLPAKTHHHSKQRVEQNELLNDGSNETSDCDTTHDRKPLTSQNLALQNKKNTDISYDPARAPSSAATSPSKGEDCRYTSPLATDPTDATTSSAKAALPKKFFCKVCNQGFTRKHNMVSHELIHTTIKLHRCESCNLQFRRIHDLKRHEKLHSGEKPFHCESCDRSFARPDALTRHLNSPHACSGMKEPDDTPQRTQTSNTLSSSYQASIRKEAKQRAEEKAHGGPDSKKAHLEMLFGDEQMLSGGSATSTASLLATGQATAISEPDSGATSSGADRPILSGPVNESTKGFHAPSSIASADLTDKMARASYDFNACKSPHMNSGEKVSESIVRGLMRKQALGASGHAGSPLTAQPLLSHSSYASHVPSVDASNADVQDTNGGQTSSGRKGCERQGSRRKDGGLTNIHPGPGAAHVLAGNNPDYQQAYSPYHRLSASMAALSKMAFQPPVRGFAADSPGGAPMANFAMESVTDANTPHGELASPRQDRAVPLQPPAPAPAPAYLGNMDPYLFQKPLQVQMPPGPPMMQQGMTPSHGPYDGGPLGHPYFPMMPAPDGWQNNTPFLPARGPVVRSASSSVHPSWSDVNSMRTEPSDPNCQPALGGEFVRADAYYELQSHANGLQTRIFSLEQRMEMLEERMKRDNKNNVKLQKRQEKKAKKRSKRAGAK